MDPQEAIIMFDALSQKTRQAIEDAQLFSNASAKQETACCTPEINMTAPAAMVDRKLVQIGGLPDKAEIGAWLTRSKLL